MTTEVQNQSTLAPQAVMSGRRFPFSANCDGDDLVVDRDGVEFVLQVEGVSTTVLQAVVARMATDHTIADLEDCGIDEGSVLQILAEFDRWALLDDVSAPEARSGLDVLLELEDLATQLEHEIMYDNSFWRTLREPPPGFNVNVMYGFVIENYHFLFRESYFDSPVLSYQPSTRVRLLMNEFYAEEYGHDELLLRALNHLGLSREDLADTMPLPGTMAMCNALTYWASNDPLFFFSTLGILEGKGVKEGEQDFYLDACDQMGLDPAFVRPVRAHARINRDGGHGNLTRALFREVPAIDNATVQRLRSRTHLFFELYDAFYAGVYNHYSTCSTLLRRVSAI